MKPIKKCSTTKTSRAKISCSSGKALVKSPKLKKSHGIAEEVCKMYVMKLRSSVNINKNACNIRKETTKRHPSKTERSFSLSTYNDQSITFAYADGSYEISVEDLGEKHKKDEVLFRYYDSQISTSETGNLATGDGVDGQRVMVNLSPTEDKDVLLHANNKECSVVLQKCENPLPDQTFFLLHREHSSSECVTFECLSNPGMFIGVKDNQLALIKLGDQTEDSSRENIIFKLSKS